ncbi:hypothetical protein, partial [Salmonella enterica]|uniref:hypothetical protein n=1 Tax=Salmonella enterica TaxID=28901 RepID=UPI003298E607
LAQRTAEQLAATAGGVLAGQGGLHAWCAWRNAQPAARAGGLGALADAIESGSLEPAQAPKAFEVNYARWWLALAVDEDEVLKRFLS